MKKKLLIIGAVLFAGVMLLAVWYFLSPSASQASLSKELSKLQLNTLQANQEMYRSGSCFDQCAQLTLQTSIPSSSDFSDLYQDYKQKLGENGYTVSTTEEEFVATTYPNGNPSGRYLVIDASAKNGYQLRISFNNATDPLSRMSKSAEVINTVDRADYTLTAQTR